MKLQTKILGSALAAAMVLTAGGASATTFMLGDLTTSGPLSKSITIAATASPVTDYFEFTVDPGVLLTYAQLEDTLNKSSSLLQNGQIDIAEETSPSVWTIDLASVQTFGAEAKSYIMPTPEVYLGAGTYRVDVTGSEVNKKATNITVGVFGTAVPEPATWAVMFVGFGAIGASMRKSRRRLAAA